MSTQLQKYLRSQIPKQISLRVVLIVPFVLQIVTAVGLVGYLSFRNGQEAVKSVAFDLCAEISDRIDQELQTFLEVPHSIHQSTEAAIRLGHINVRDLTGLRRYFWQQVHIFTSVSDIGLGNAQGEVVAVSSTENGTGSVQFSNAATKYNLEVYKVDAAGEPTTLDYVTPNFDPVQRPWYQDAARTGQSSWTEIYPTSGKPGLALSAVLPIYDQQGHLEAVLYNLMHLSQLGNYLQSLKIGKTGQSFIIESDGELVATSTGETLLQQKNEDQERLAATESSDPITQATSQYLLTKFGDFEHISDYQQIRFEINHQPYYVQVLPFHDARGLDWFVVVVVPEADFMAQIHANNRNTVLLCLLVFGVATGAGILTACWINRSITHRLQKLAVGTNDYLTKSVSKDELLARIHTHLQIHHLEEETIRLTVAHEQQLAQFLDALPVGVAVHHSDGSIFYFNQMAKQLLQHDIVQDMFVEQFTSAYQFYQTGTNTLYPAEQLPVIRVLQGECVRIEDIELHVNEAVIPLEVLGTPILNEKGEVEYAIITFQDITERKRAEQILADYSYKLEQDVSQRITEFAQINDQLQQEIQEREQVEAALRYSQEQLRLITDSVPAGIAYVDAERRYRFVNKAYEVRFNRSRETILGKYVWDIIGQDAYNNVKDTIDQVLQGKQQAVEFDITYQTGSTSYISSILTPDFDQSNTVAGYYLVFFDITERRRLEESLKQANDELERLVTVDGLTLIANRRKFDDYLMHEWKRLARSQEVLSLILFDVDFFKRYNDYYGHQAGDTCLQKIAQAVKQVINRPADLVARYGGEEFAVILPNTDEQGAVAIAEHIQHVVRALAIPHSQSEVSPIVSVSLGIASMTPTPESSPDVLITLADQTLYIAKQQGRDRFSSIVQA